MKHFLKFFAVLAALSLQPLAARADDLIGSSVSGSLSSGFFTSVSSGFSSPTVASSGATFSGVMQDESFGQTFDFSVNFSATSFTIDITSSRLGANVSAGRDMATVTLTDADFTSAMDLASFSCAAGSYGCNDVGNALLSDTFSGDTVTISFEGLGEGSVYTFGTVAPAVSATPEPESLALLSTGLLGVAGAVRRRKR